MNDSIRVRLSAGLVCVALLHAVALAGIFLAAHPPRSAAQSNPCPCDDMRLPEFSPRYPNGQPTGNFDRRGESVQLLPVNPQARDEVKRQQSPCPDGSCTLQSLRQVATTYQAQIHARDGSYWAALPEGRVWVSSGQRGTHAYSGPNAYVQLLQAMQRGTTAASHNPQPHVTPNVPSPPSVPARPQVANRHQLALFVGNDSQSRRLEEWFARDPNLASLRTKVDFQVYRPENKLYQQRFASIVPVSQFPAVLFLKPDGGHIHAAGRAMIPATAGALYSDLEASN